jgi:hypothetical protein
MFSCKAAPPEAVSTISELVPSILSCPLAVGYMPHLQCLGSPGLCTAVTGAILFYNIGEATVDIMYINMSPNFFIFYFFFLPFLSHELNRLK